MTRNLKTLGLALVAVCAMSAVAASAASANLDTFHSEIEPTTITATQTSNHVFQAGAKSTCKKASFQGTVAKKTSTEITVHPTYSECELEGIGATTIDTAGCNFIFKGATDKNVHASNALDATVAVECEGSNTIKITGPGCTVSVGGAPNNQNLLGVSYKNTGTEKTRDIDVTATVFTIHFTSSGFLCALAGIPATGTTGTYTGSATVIGEEGTTQRGIWFTEATT